MKREKCVGWFLIMFLVAPGYGIAQEKHYYQTDFTKEEFAERRGKIFDQIGKNAVAVIQGAKSGADFSVFRQTNEF